MTLLRMEHVNAHYGKVQALYDASLLVEEGEIVALIGSERRRKNYDVTLYLRAGQAEFRSDLVW